MTLLISSKSSRVQASKESSSSLPLGSQILRRFRTDSPDALVCENQKFLTSNSFVTNENENENMLSIKRKHKRRISKKLKSTRKIFKKPKWFSSRKKNAEEEADDEGSSLDQNSKSALETHSLQEIGRTPGSTAFINSAISSALSALRSGLYDLSPSVFQFPMQLRNIFLVRSIVRYLLSQIVINRRLNVTNYSACYSLEDNSTETRAKSSVSTNQQKISNQSALLNLLRRIKALVKLFSRIGKMTKRSCLRLKNVAKDRSSSESDSTQNEAQSVSLSQNSEDRYYTDNNPQLSGFMSPLEYGDLSDIEGTSGILLNGPYYENHFQTHERTSSSNQILNNVEDFLEIIPGYESSIISIDGNIPNVLKEPKEGTTKYESLEGNFPFGFQNSSMFKEEFELVVSGTSESRNGDTDLPIFTTTHTQAEENSDGSFEKENIGLLMAARDLDLEDSKIDNFENDQSYVAYLEFASSELPNIEPKETSPESTPTSKPTHYSATNIEPTTTSFHKLGSESSEEGSYKFQNREDSPDLITIRKGVARDVKTYSDSGNPPEANFAIIDFRESIPSIPVTTYSIDGISPFNITDPEPSTFSSTTLEAIVEEAEDEPGETFFPLTEIPKNSASDSEMEFYQPPETAANFNPFTIQGRALETIEETLETSPSFSVNLAIMEHSALETSLLESATVISCWDEPAKSGKNVEEPKYGNPFQNMPGSSKIIYHTFNPCTKTRKEWVEYSDSDSDDSVYETFFTSHGKLCPPKHPPKKYSFASTVNFSQKPIKSGSLRVSECSSADIPTTNSTECSNFSLEKRGASSSQNCWRKISLEDLFCSTSNLPSPTKGNLPIIADAGDHGILSFKVSDSKEDIPSQISTAKEESSSGNEEEEGDGDDKITLQDFVCNEKNQTEMSEQRNDVSLSSWVQTESLFLLLKGSIGSTDTQTNTEKTKPVSDSTLHFQEEEFPLICEDSSLINLEENTIPNFEPVLDFANEWKQLHDRSTLTPSGIQDTTILMDLIGEYRRFYLHLIKNVVLPCNFRIRRLIEDILSIRRTEKELISLETGTTNDITTLLQQFEGDTELDSDYWKKRLQTSDSHLASIDINFKKNKNNLELLRVKFSHELANIMDLITHIRESKSNVLKTYYQFCDSCGLQEGLQTPDIHQYTFVDEYKQKTLWYFQLNPEEIENLLSGNMRSLTETMDLVGVRMESIHENLSSAKETINEILPLCEISTKVDSSESQVTKTDLTEITGEDSNEPMNKKIKRKRRKNKPKKNKRNNKR